MGRVRCELLKCDDCGKTLGYMHESVKIFPPKGWIRLIAGGPIIKIEKEVFVKNVLRKEKQIKDYRISPLSDYLIVVPTVSPFTANKTFSGSNPFTTTIFIPPFRRILTASGSRI